MQDVASGTGRTVLFVSHNMPAVQNLCSRCIFLESGRLKMDGDTGEVLTAYNRATAGLRSTTESLETHSGRTSGSIPSMTEIRIRAEGDMPDFIRMGD